MIRRLIFLTVGLFVLCSMARAGDAWPQFRGPDASGVAEGQNLPRHWSSTENVRWKRDLPGRGWSSPVVWRDRVFVTTAVSEGELEEVKKGLYFGGERPPTGDLHEWKTLCLDLQTGEVQWERTAHRGAPEAGLHVKNSFASETPVTDGERVYAYFGNLGLFCYDMLGNELWSKSFAPVATRMSWGTAASPVLHEDRIYIVNDNEDQSYLAALDKRTGEEVWRVDRDEKSNWSTPFIWKNALRTEIVTTGTNKFRAYDLEGRQLYEFGDASVITIPTPTARHGLLYVSSGYVLDFKNRPVFALRPGAAGDISLEDDQSENEFIAWRQRHAAPYNTSPLVYGEYLYVLLDRGFFACYNARTGEEVYSRQRLPEGRAFTSSPCGYNDRVFCLNEDGKTFVMAAGAGFELLHVNTLAEDDLCMATPAIVGEKLLIRTAARLYCIENASAHP